MRHSSIPTERNEDLSPTLVFTVKWEALKSYVQLYTSPVQHQYISFSQNLVYIFMGADKICGETDHTIFVFILITF